MLEKIVELSVRRRGVVLVIWALIAIAAGLAARKLSIDAVPDVTNTQVSVLTSAPGLSPVEVEKYLTFPIETAMNGIPGVSYIRSISRTAVSAVTVAFRDGTDPWFARQLVNERLKLAEADIPPGYGHPELGPVSTGLGEIYEFFLTSDRHSPMELRTLLDWTVAYRLRSVPGVVEVNGMGGEAKQYQVVLDPRRLAGYHLSLQNVERALEENNASIGGGYVERDGESYVIRSDGQFHSIEDIENTVLSSDQDGTPVLLKNVATVRIGPALRFGAVTKHGDGEIVAGTVMMLTGANSREVVEAVKTRLAEIQAELPAGVVIRSYYDRAEFINRMLKTVAINLGEGALLVVVVLFLTLGSLRGSLIVALAIPLAMAIAVMGMVRMGVTGNLMSLGAIDFGLLVDGAIVMLELALVRIAAASVTTREGIAAEVATAMKRAARPVSFSLAIILLVYIPLLTLEGVEGKMFKPMAITVALALGGALAFSLTAFPALAAFVLPAPRRTHDGATGVWARLERRYHSALDAVHGTSAIGPGERAAAPWRSGRSRLQARRRIRSSPRRRRAVARHQTASVGVDLGSPAIGDGGRAGSEPLSGGAFGRHANGTRRGRDRSCRTRRDRGHGQAAAQGRLGDGTRSGRPGRRDQARRSKAKFPRRSCLFRSRSRTA